MSKPRNTAVGHSYERELVTIFKEIGFADVATSRACNRTRDAQKIDLANTDESIQGRLPYNVQAKCMVGTIPYQKILGEIPVTPGLINVVLHKKTEKAKTGSKFLVKERYAFMYQHDFFQMVKQLEELKKENKLLLTQQTSTCQDSL